tara:strand:+ start:36265 stop:37587 length:1323 start_codon:yes stop_codon:yes gene_type:complete
MSELIIIIAIITLRLDRDLKHKHLTGLAVTILSIGLWSIHAQYPHSYLAIVLATSMMANRYWNFKHPLVNLQTMGIMSIVTLTSANWSVPIVSICFLIGLLGDKSTGNLKQVTLLILSALALNTMVPYGHVAFVVSIVTTLFLANCIWREKLNEGLVWVSVLCVNLIVSGYNVKTLALSVCAVLAVAITVGMWASDRDGHSWKRLAQIFCVVIAVSSIHFGLIGFWAGVIAMASLITILDKENEEQEIIKLPYPAMSTFILLPVGPMMFLLVNGKSGQDLALGLVVAFSAAVSSWKWISQLEKKASDIKIGYLKLAHSIVLLGFMVMGSIFFMAEGKMGLVSYLTMAFAILILFSVMKIDDKLLKLSGRKFIDLRMNQHKLIQRRSISYNVKGNLAGTVTNTVRASWVLLEEILEYSAKIYPVIALVAIIGVIAAGILDG